MTSDTHNPALQSLFASARQDLDGESFTSGVMDQAQDVHRKRVILGIGIGIVLALLAYIFRDFGAEMTNILLTSIIDLEEHFLAQVLAPLNTLGSVLSMILLGLRIAHRRLFK